MRKVVDTALSLKKQGTGVERRETGVVSVSDCVNGITIYLSFVKLVTNPR